MPRATTEAVLALLAPLFLATTGDERAARSAAQAALDSYGPRTDRELRLAALSIAFALNALQALGHAASPETTPNQAIRLRSNANALHRSAQQCEARLEALRTTQQEPAEPQPAATTCPPLLDNLPKLSRQQRRAAERIAVKLLRGQKPQPQAA
jgi:hypothetical protein